jgi:uncharacterized sulfatase
MDDGVGQIMARLKELNIDGTTLVIFFPDNGAAGDTRGFRVTGSQIDRLGEGGVRVSFIARWPRRFAGTITEVMSALDIFPTLAASAARRCLLRLDGRIRRCSKAGEIVAQ